MAFFLLSTAIVYAQSTGPSQQETKSKSKNTAQDQQSSKEPTLVDKVPTSKPSQQTGAGNQTKTHMKTPDERIADFTFWLVIVASIQAAIFVGQGIAMFIQAKRLRDAVKAAEKAADVAELSAQAVVRMELPIVRAIPQDLLSTEHLISSDERPYGGYVNDHSPTKYSAVGGIKFTNYGRTPAFPETFSVGWIVTTKLPDNPIYTSSSILSHSKVIKPRGVFMADTHYGIELTQEELKSTQEGRSWLWFYGCLFYRDFMNERRESRFCWRFSNQNPKGMRDFHVFASDGNPPEGYTKNA